MDGLFHGSNAAVSVVGVCRRLVTFEHFGEHQNVRFPTEGIGKDAHRLQIAIRVGTNRLPVDESS